MDMTPPVVAALIAALIALVLSLVTFSMTKYHNRLSLQRLQLRDTVAALASSGRRMLHLAGEGPVSTDRFTELKDEQASIRVAVEALGLVGDSDVQCAALLARRHSYAVIELARGRDDPRPEYPGTPRVRLEDAIVLLITAARAQLEFVGVVKNDVDYLALTLKSHALRQSIEA